MFALQKRERLIFPAEFLRPNLIQLAERGKTPNNILVEILP